jgi:hypothetical protein
VSPRSTTSVGLVAIAAVTAAVFVSRGVADPAFPAGTPQWIATAATRTAQSLGDPKADVVSVSLGRFPVVVLKGAFTCTQCSGPSSTTPAQTGTYVGLRFDAVTHRSTDFALAPTKEIATSSLCGGSPCTARAIYLDSAFVALYAHSRGIGEPFDHRIGRSHCKITLPVQGWKWIWGQCSVTMSITPRRTVVTFSETWNGLDRYGRRYSPQSPVHHHVWKISESHAGFVTAFRSTGDHPPQWRR